MTLRKAAFSITCDTNGMGVDDVRLPINTFGRHAQLYRVVVDRAACFGSPSVCISELDDVEDAAWNDTAETLALGRQLAFIDRGLSATEGDGLIDSYDVRVNAVTLFGETPSVNAPDALVLIKTNDIRCEVNGANSGDVLAVTLYYETAGDYRF